MSASGTRWGALAAWVQSSPDMARAFAKDVLGPVLDLGGGEDQRLLDQQILLNTLRTWFQVGGRAEQAARLLYCHRNTVRNRLARLEKLTGRSLLDFRDLAELLIAVEAAALLDTDTAMPTTREVFAAPGLAGALAARIAAGLDDESVASWGVTLLKVAPGAHGINALAVFLALATPRRAPAAVVSESAERAS